MARIYYNAVFSGHGGRMRGDDIQVMQNAIETDLVFDCFFEDGEVYNFVGDETITGYFRDVDDAADYQSVGTFTPGTGTNQFTWLRDASDVGTPSLYKIAFKVVPTSGDPDFSIVVEYRVDEVPDGTDTPLPPPNVGVTPAEKAWLDVQVPALAVMADGQIVTVSSGTLADAGFAMSWNATDSTVDVPLNASVTGQMFQELLIYARNNTGSQIDNGDIVRLNGTTGDRVTITLAQADTHDNAQQVGMATEDIANNSAGFVAIIGLVRGQDTNSFTEGDQLYLSAVTPGLKTNVKPTWPAISIEVGLVQRKHPSDGIVFVNAYETGAGAWEKATDAAAASVPIVGGSMTGGLSIAVPTATDTPLILQTTDDDGTNNLLTAKNTAGTAVMTVTPTGGATFSGNVTIIDPTSTELLILNGDVGQSSTKFIIQRGGVDFAVLQTHDSRGMTLGSNAVPLNLRSNATTTGTHGLRIDTNNNVGIWTNTPLAQLHITAQSATTIGGIFQSAAGASVNILEIQDSAGTMNIALADDGYIRFRGATSYIRGAASGTLTLSSSNSTISTAWGTHFAIYGTSGFSALVVDGLTTNNVGIGTSAPLAQLHTIARTATTIGGIFQAAAAASVNIIEAQDSGSAIQFAIGEVGQIQTNQDAANVNTPSGATAHQLPIYNEAGTLLGYIPIYAAAW